MRKDKNTNVKPISYEFVTMVIVIVERGYYEYSSISIIHCFTDLCPDACPSKYEPVCGNDGRTYSSRCELGRQACTNNPQLRAIYAGECVPSCKFYIQLTVYIITLFGVCILKGMQVKFHVHGAGHNLA